MLKRTRADLASEWAEVGDAVTKAMPKARIRRLLGAIRKLLEAKPADAIEAIDTLEYMAMGRAALSVEETLMLIESRAREARQHQSRPRARRATRKGTNS